MKKTFMFCLILITLSLTACGASNSQAVNPDGNTSGSGNGNSFLTAPLPVASEMLIGIFKLEGTAKAVTADEAAQLLPLWQVYKDLSTSTSASQTEVDALADQIKGTMTPEQVQAITDMKLTRADIFKTMTDLGIAPTAGGPNASGTPRPNGGNFTGGGNGFGGGGNGAPGGGFGNGQNLTPQQIATFQAQRAQNGGNGRQNRIPSALYDALIKLLQSKK